MLDLDDLEFEDDIFEDEIDLYGMDDDADALLGSATILGGAGAGLGSYLGTKAHDWLYKGKPKNSDRRSTWQNVGAGALGSLGAGLGALVPGFESDPGEPEYEVDDIDEMEALLEEALEADGEDAEIAMDQMISRAFGMMRGISTIRRVMVAVKAKVRSIIARARRDPRFRSAARMVPIALRRTAAALLKRYSRRQPVTPQIALRVFAGVLSSLMRQPSARKRLSRASTLRARRYRQRRGMSRPRATQRRHMPRRAY